MAYAGANRLHQAYYKRVDSPITNHKVCQLYKLWLFRAFGASFGIASILSPYDFALSYLSIGVLVFENYYR
jgi:hypothetical protein